MGHPDQLNRILGLGNSHPIKVGVITNYAEQGSKRFGAFQDIYGQLSRFAHPMAKSIFASTTPTEAGVPMAVGPRIQVMTPIFWWPAPGSLSLRKPTRICWCSTRTLKPGELNLDSFKAAPVIHRIGPPTSNPAHSGRSRSYGLDEGEDVYLAVPGGTAGRIVIHP